MSLQDVVLMSTYLAMLLSILWKWNKFLLFLVNFEVLAVIIFVSLIMSSLTGVLLLLMVFVVGESLILISAFFSSMRVLGATYSSVMVWYSNNYLLQVFSN